MTFALLVVSTTAAVLGASAPLWWRLEGPVSPLFWHGIASGASLILAGFVAMRWRSARAVARLMLLSGALYFVPYLSFAGSDVAYTIGIVTSGIWLAIGGHLIVAFPDGRLRSRLERRVVLGVYGWMLLAHTQVLFADPRLLGCEDCPRNLLLVSNQPQIATPLLVADGVVPVLVVALVLAVLARRWRAATRPERHVLAPVFLALGTNAAIAAPAYLLNGLWWGGLVPDAVLEAAIIVQRSAVIFIAVGILIGLARTVSARAAIGNLLVRIGEGRTPDQLERDIAWALGDPSIRLGLRRGGGEPLVDAAGRPLITSDLGPHRVSRIEGPDGSEVVLVHDPWIGSEQPELLRAVASATRLAIENSQLQAALVLHRDLPHGLAERVMERGGSIGETSRVTISVLMSDVRGFVTIAEIADPEGLAGQLNEHRAAMTRAVTAHGGTLMQFVGDAVFAVFGAPDPMDDHAPRAVAAATEMHRRQAALNDDWVAAGLPRFDLGIAVTTGEVAAALLGSDEHVEYSVVGDAVNLAQRIQVLAAAGDVVIDDQTARRLHGAAELIPNALASVKGRVAPVSTYRVGPAPVGGMAAVPAADPAGQRT